MKCSSLSQSRFFSACAVAVSAAAALYALEAGSSAMALAASVPAVFSLLSIWSCQRAFRSVKAATDACRRLGAGDFDTRIFPAEGKGAIWELGWAINDMTDRMDAFIREATAAMDYVSRNQYFRNILEDGMGGIMLNGSRVINKATETVKTKMNGFMTVASDFDHSLQSVVTGLHGTVANLNDMSRAMDSSVTQSRTESKNAVSASSETSSSVQIISSAAEEMSSSVHEISQQIALTSQVSEHAADESRKVEETMRQLVHTTERINAVIQLIEDIAEQTNLLALNATIEAARAGDAGKGFAIVASEVKALAGQTAAATDEIRSHIVNVQTASQSAAGAFKGIDGIIAEIKVSATAVAAAIEQQAAASREIAGSALKAAEGTAQVSHNITDIDETLGEVGASTVNIRNIASHLSGEVAKDVQDLLGKMNAFMTELKKIA